MKITRTDNKNNVLNSKIKEFTIGKVERTQRERANYFDVTTNVNTKEVPK